MRYIENPKVFLPSSMDKNKIFGYNFFSIGCCDAFRKDEGWEEIEVSLHKDIN
jgi:hypothetical protein